MFKFYLIEGVAFLMISLLLLIVRRSVPTEHSDLFDAAICFYAAGSGFTLILGILCI